MRILGKLEKSRDFWFLFITSFIFSLFRLPSLFEPYWYGDEGIYQAIGIAMRQGRLLYGGIWDNKPPFLYVLYYIFDSDQFALRLVSLVFGLLSVFVFFLLAKKLFSPLTGGNKIVYFTTFLFSFFFGIPLIEGNIANAENFMLLPILLSGLLIYKSVSVRHSGESRFNRDESRILSILRFWTSQNDQFNLFLSGLLLSVAFLFKIVAVFDFAAFFIFILFATSLKSLNKLELLTKLSVFSAGFLVPIFLTILYFFANGALSDFLSASFLQNVGYVGYGNKFIIPQGFLFLKVFLLFIAVVIVFIKKETLGKSSIFILLWIFFALFNAFFSQRPYPHYLLVLLPAFILFAGLVISSTGVRKIYLFLLIAIFVLLAKNFSVSGKTPFYYQNFISFAFGNKSLVSYQAFFDRQTPADYQIAQFLKSHTKREDNIFIWGNNAQVYKMTNKLPPGKYTVAYHMTSSKKSIEETAQAFYNKNPKYVVVTSWRNPIPFKLTKYSLRLVIKNTLIYENIF